MNEIQSALDTLLPAAVRVVDVCAVSGGCISDAVCVAVEERGVESRLFVKNNRASFLENFQCEADGLEALGSADAIAVPQPIAVGLAAGRAWLISQWIDQKPRSTAFFGKFGRQLAKLHRETRGRRDWVAA